MSIDRGKMSISLRRFLPIMSIIKNDFSCEDSRLINTAH